MPITVFLGPSLPREEAAAILDARYLPPAAFGDIYRLMGGETRVILLLDGVFHGRAPVWQREILCALEAGIRVYGASSMGALRAAELGVHGMIGLGAVYTWYASGEIDGDDEVALLHAGPEQGHKPLTSPLVNLRFNLREAAARGLLDAEQASSMIRYLQSLPFWERSVAALWDAPIARSLDVAALRAFFARDAVDLKRRDALFALEEVARRERDAATREMPLRAPATPAPAPSHHDRNRLLERRFYDNEGAPLSGKDLAARALSDPARRRIIHWSLAARFFADQSIRGISEELAPLADEALLASLPDMDWDPLKPMMSRAVIAGALPHVAAWCREVGAAPSPEEASALQRRWRGALAQLAEAGRSRSIEPLLAALWALGKGPVYFGYASWSVSAALVEALAASGAAASVMDRLDRREMP